jgi:hypothetical protein
VRTIGVSVAAPATDLSGWTVESNCRNHQALERLPAWALDAEASLRQLRRTRTSPLGVVALSGPTLGIRAWSRRLLNWVVSSTLARARPLDPRHPHRDGEACPSGESPWRADVGPLSNTGSAAHRRGLELK